MNNTIKKFIYCIKIIFINILLLYFFLYLIEIGINFNKKRLYKKTRLYYLNTIQNENLNKNIYLNFGSYKLINKKNNSLLPLSGYKNSIIILCLDEHNKPIYYLSDNNGFSNKKKNTINDFLLIGDSYVHGMCVNTKDNLNSQFEKFFFKTSSLGVGGNGPLLEFATFKEYEEDYNYKDLILFITPSNDFKDLSIERSNRILMNYLNVSNFKQNIKKPENELKKEIILNDFFGNKAHRFFNDFFSVYHFNLKQLGNLLEKILKNEYIDNNYDYLKDESLDRLFFKILNEFNKFAKSKDKKFYVVFNSLNPDFLFPTTKDTKKLKDLLIDDKLKKIKKHLNQENILFIDYNEYILKNYDKNNISTIFKKIDGHWDHYTERGFFELTEQINYRLIK
tara:strand:- start:180 stop:1361 length:1182 start_codon:yes stop_codon:yes gene_type:complete